MKRLFFTTGLALFIALPVWAHSNQIKDVEIDHPVATPTVAGAPTAAVYFTIINRGKSADRLLGATTPRARRVELHTMTMAGDVMRMREVASIDAKPGQAVKMQPGSSNHLMLVGLAAPLKPGEHFPVTLRFEKAGRVEIEVMVQSGSPAKEAVHPH